MNFYNVSIFYNKMTEKTEIGIQTEHEKHVVIDEYRSSLPTPDSNQNVLDQTEIKKILKDLEQQTKILTETAKKIDIQKKILKHLNTKINDDDDDDESAVEDDDDDDDDDKSAVEDDDDDDESAVEDDDIRWLAMLKLLDAHQNISQSVHKLIHEDEEEDDE